MVTPLDWTKEQAGKVKQAVYPDPDTSSLQAQMETEKKDNDFRQLNYYPNKPVTKPKPIKLSGKITSGKVDVGGKR